MNSKYNMKLEDNIHFAKRKLVDSIYNSANLEGIAITFAETYSFMENINTGNISVDDMLKLRGLRDAWELVLKNPKEVLTLDYIKKIQFQLCKGQNVMPLGEFRDKGVGITGTNYRPKLPIECDYEYELNEILNIDNKLDSILTLFCYLQRTQMFIDGNKRVANLIANKELIKNGLGIIMIPTQKIGEYISLLINYYETNNNQELKNWLYENALDGIE